jgi:hypothetical protein
MPAPLGEIVDTLKEPPPSSVMDAEIVAVVDTPKEDATVVAQSVPSSAQLTEAQMRALLDAVSWPVATREAALAIARCESGWRTDATGAEGERGLFQVHPRWHPDATYDPEGNARAAMRISSGGTDWSAWTCRKVLK